MRTVTYSLGLSLDGYVMGPDGGFDWAAPDDEMFAFVTEEIRLDGVHLLGRRLYEAMLVWEDDEQVASFDGALQDWAARWRRLPKVVFSRSLDAVQGNARLATGGLTEEIERLKAEPGEGDIAIGGADLAQQAIDAGLVDEFRMRVHPVLVGGGTTYFPHHERRDDLELLESRMFRSGVVFLRYRVLR
jgi:dihydrofolate reductase